MSINMSEDKRNDLRKKVSEMNLTQENKSKILRLKNHEAWVIVNVNNKDVELHLRD